MSFDNEAEGDKFVALVEASLDQGIIPYALLNIDKKVLTFADAVCSYQIEQAIKDSDVALLDLAQREHNKLRLAEINHHWLAVWIRDMKLVGQLAPSTIRHKVGAVARCLDWCVRMGHMGVNPCRSLPRGYAAYSEHDAMKTDGGREDVERERRVEPGEEPAIRKVLSGEKREGRQRALELRHKHAIALLFELGLESAMRMKEMYTLTLDQVDFKKDTIFLEKTKNGDRRQVPMTSVAKDRLYWYIESDRDEILARDGMLFPWLMEASGGIPPTKYTFKKVTALLSRQFARIFETAGCEDLGFHDLRHEATCRLYEKTTLSDIQISKITGHKNLQMLRRYSNLRGSDLSQRLW